MPRERGTRSGRKRKIEKFKCSMYSTSDTERSGGVKVVEEKFSWGLARRSGSRVMRGPRAQLCRSSRGTGIRPQGGGGDRAAIDRQHNKRACVLASPSIGGSAGESLDERNPVAKTLRSPGGFENNCADQRRERSRKCREEKDVRDYIVQRNARRSVRENIQSPLPGHIMVYLGRGKSGASLSRRAADVHSRAEMGASTSGEGPRGLDRMLR